jgi:uncharacterized protein (DUF2164 family)
MSDIEFSDDQRARLVAKVKTYFSEALDQDIGAFDAEFLIDFIAKEIGPSIYNRGLADAHQLFNEKSEELGYLIAELEKPEI